jgi:hypothetical protein
MANRIYLCATRHQHIYPSFCEGDYDASEQTLAADVYCVPLLWLALFQREDIQVKHFDVRGERVRAFAPVAARKKAIRQLRNAVPYLESILQTSESLLGHAKLVATLLGSSPCEYVTIEWQEIEVLAPQGVFERKINAAFRAMEVQRRPSQGFLRRLFSKDSIEDLFYGLTEIKKGSRIPAADSLLTGAKLSDDEIWNLTRVLGTRHIRDVPWE